MTLYSLNLRKNNDCIDCFGYLNKHLATVCGNTVTFLMPVTPEELNTINWVAQNFDILIINIIEE